MVAALAFVPRQRFTLAATADQTAYPGKGVTVTVELAVGGSEPVSIQSRCVAYQLGFIVTTKNGNLVYSSMDPTAVLSCLRADSVATLNPGWVQSRSFEWNQLDETGLRVPVGQTYYISPVLFFGVASVSPLTSGSQIFVQ